MDVGVHLPFDSLFNFGQKQRMQIQVRFFASLREAVGQDQVLVSCPESATVATLFDQLCLTYPQLEPFRSSLLPARNLTYTQWDQFISDGDEVAFIPPVAGGAS